MDDESYPKPAPPTKDYSAEGLTGMSYSPSGPEIVTHTRVKLPGAVIAVLVLLFVGGLAIAGFALFSSSSASYGPPIEEPYEDYLGSVRDLPTAQTAWDEFAPPPYDTSVYPAPSERIAALMEETHSALYPDFAVTNVAWLPGHTDDEAYWMHGVYVACELVEEPAIRIAYTVWFQNEDAIADGIAYDPAALDDSEGIGTTSDGVEYVYRDTWLAGLIGGVSNPDVVALVAQVQRDFPDSLVDFASIETDRAWVSITCWDTYPPNANGFSLTYTPAGEGWAFESMEPWTASTAE